MAQYSITIPADVDERLNEEATKRNEDTPTYIAELVAADRRENTEHLEETIDRQHTLIDKLERDLDDVHEQLQREQDTVAHVEELGRSLKKLESSLAEMTDRNRLLTEQLQKSEASKEAAHTELQHQIDLLERERSDMRVLLQEERGHVQELRADKVRLQDRIDLLSTRFPDPPPPKHGWRDRLLGSRRKD